MTEYSVAFCMPTYGSVPPEAAMNFAMTYQTTMCNGISGAICATIQPCVDRARNDLVKRALDLDTTHVMWIDSDVITPSQTVVRLLSHQVPITSGLYHYKVPPYNPVAFQINPTFVHITTPEILEGLCEVDGVGMGCVLMTSQLLRDIAEHYKDEVWFRMTPEEGEDVYFFRRLNAMGVNVLLDPAVRCGHLRYQAVTTEDWIGCTK